MNSGTAPQPVMCKYVSVELPYFSVGQSSASTQVDSSALNCNAYHCSCKLHNFTTDSNVSGFFGGMDNCSLLYNLTLQF